MIQIQKKQLNGLFEKAEKDYQLLSFLIGEKKFYSTYFFAQQAIEKSFKVIILLKGFTVPKTHDLLELYNIAEKLYTEGTFQEIGKRYTQYFELLTELYLDERYSYHEDDDYNVEDLKVIQGCVENIVQFTRETLQKNGL